jgi:hypothetical protein
MPDLVTRQLVLLGDTDPELKVFSRKPLVSRSICRFVCDDDLILAECVEQIRISDEHLRSRPEELMLWGWNATFVEKIPGQIGGVVILGVNWYDETFFNERRNSYVNPSHLQKYLQIGFSLENLTVEHWKVVK